MRPKSTEIPVDGVGGSTVRPKSTETQDYGADKNGVEREGSSQAKSWRIGLEPHKYVRIQAARPPRSYAESSRAQQRRRTVLRRTHYASTHRGLLDVRHASLVLHRPHVQECLSNHGTAEGIRGGN